MEGRAFGEGQSCKRRKQGHTQSALLAHHTHTPNMYTNINIPMYKFTWDSQIAPLSFSQHPQPVPYPGSTLG